MEGLLGAVVKNEALPDKERLPTEEVRFGVILNGGVSLAVWMGGTVLELDRLIKALERAPQPVQPPARERDPYAVLLRLTGCTARADVFAGTSAGGINGAALALAQVNRGADLGMLRGLWIEQGRIESLLRQPFQGDPTSLLRGDEFFLPALHDAMIRLARAPGHTGPQEVPVDLTITATVLGGNQTVTLDSMGQKLPQTVHAGLFRWQRGAHSPQGRDPFDLANIELTARQLALASRSTASFPVAFEPSFIPVNSPDFPAQVAGGSPAYTSEAQRLRPDMSRVVQSWGTGSPKQNKSRFVIDGGVLANTPTRSALQAVEAMGADGSVRRVMLLVYPHAPSPSEDLPALFGAAPTVAGALNGLLGALSGQGGRTYVDQLEEHNRRAAGRRGTRSDILEVTPPDELYALAHRIYPHYRQLREWRAGRDLASRLTGTDEDGTASRALPEGWNFERVRLEAQRAQRDWRDTHQNFLPYVPADLPVDPRPGSHTPTVVAAATAPATPAPAAPSPTVVPPTATTSTTPQAATPEPPGAHTPPPSVGWGWGVSGALGVTEAAGELLRQVVATLRTLDKDYEAVAEARRKTFQRRSALEPMREAVDMAWATNRGDGPDTDRVIGTLALNRRYWTLRLAFYDHLMVGSTTWAQVEILIDDLTKAEGRLAAERAPRGAAGLIAVEQARAAEVNAALLKRLDTNAAAKAAMKAAHDVAGNGAADGSHAAATPTMSQNLEQNAGAVGQQIRILVDDTVAELAGVIARLYPQGGSAAGGRTARDSRSRSYGESLKWVHGLGLDQADLSKESLLVRLLHLEVAATALGDEVNTGTTQPVELVQLSAQTANGFAEYSRTADDKLGGWSVNRFGGFLKRSWRANDWTWGRVDAATVLCRTVLQPSRIRRTARLTGYRTGNPAERAEATLKELVNHLFDEERPDLQPLLVEAQHELTNVFDEDNVDEGDLPASLPALAGLFARALHEQIVVEELPAIATAIRADKVEGGYQRSRGEVFLASESALLARLEQSGPLDAAQRTRALNAFDSAGIGREPLREESSSDMSIRTATTAAAVVTTVLSSGRSGLKAISPVTRAVRGLMMLPYWVVTGLTSKGGLTRTLSVLALALGGTLLALSLFGALPESFAGPATALGASAVLVAFAYAALRTGTVLHGVVLLSPVIPLLTYSVVRARDSDGASAAQGSTTLVVVIALTVVLMLLGSFGASYGSVWSALDRLAERRGVRRVKGSKAFWHAVGWGEALLRSLFPPLVVVLVVVALAWVVTEALQANWVKRMNDWEFPWKWGLVAVILASATLLGAVLAVRSGRSLQALARVPERDADGKVRADTGGNGVFIWEHQSVANPRGVAVGWSVLYGIGYELFGVALLLDWFNKNEAWWYKVALITAALFAVTLVLVTPAVLPMLEYRSIRRFEQNKGIGTLRTEADYASDLANRGLGYRHYVKGGSTPILTPSGERLHKAVQQASDPHS